jgi:hypothetical protein
LTDKTVATRTSVVLAQLSLGSLDFQAR